MRKFEKVVLVLVIALYVFGFWVPFEAEAAAYRSAGFRVYKPVAVIAEEGKVVADSSQGIQEQSGQNHEDSLARNDAAEPVPVYGSRFNRDYFQVGIFPASAQPGDGESRTNPDNAESFQQAGNGGVIQSEEADQDGYNYSNSYYDRYNRRGVYVPSTQPEVSDKNQDGQQASPQEPKKYQMPETPAGLTPDEAKAFELLNEFRIENGVPPVEIDMQLVELARMKARDKVENGYSGHISPTYGSPGRMVQDAEISYKKVAENYAKAGNVTQCHYLLAYSSKGHREIMLNSDYTHVGIGIVELTDVPGIIMIQLFIQPR